MTISDGIFRKNLVKRTILFLICVSCTGNNDEISFINRESWNAVPPIHRKRMKKRYRQGIPFDGMCIHYSGFDTDMSLRALQQYHMIRLQYPDIAYHYVIDTRGQIYQGRETLFFSDFPEKSLRSIHICCISDLKFSSNKWLPKTQVQALKKLILQLINDFNINDKNVYFCDSTGYENLNMELQD